MKDKLTELADRLGNIARRIENVGLVRAAEDVWKIVEELKGLAAADAAKHPT